MATGLRSFLKLSRLNPKTRHALTVFIKPEDAPRKLSFYEDQFWRILASLIEADEASWPDDRPQNPEHSEWEFCFDGEPMFVFSANPGYDKRDSRFFGNSHLMLFQPRRIFDGIEGGTPTGTRVRRQIRKKLESWEQMPPHPDMGSYGDPSSNEWKQYFLPDDNTPLPSVCPLSRHEAKSSITSFPASPRILRGQPININDAVLELLPETGSVEVQRDTPRRQHPPHTHPTHETLLIVEGEIEFEFAGSRAVCRSGDRLLLPVGTRHSSIAGHEGCLYVIGLHVGRPATGVTA